MQTFEVTVQLFLFGRFQLHQNGLEITLPTRKVESLLAYLALHPGFHSREKIAALFWGDVSDEQARASLRGALPALRKLLGPCLLANREAIALVPDVSFWVDVHALHTAMKQPVSPESLPLYRDELLRDCYDEWVLPLRQQWQEKFVVWLWQGAQLAHAQTAYQQAITLGQHLLVVEPAHEQAYQLLMHCYHALGDRSAALRQYDRCVQLLNQELGVKPSSQTVELLQRIKTAVSTTPSHTPLTNLPAPLSTFIGRETAVSALLSLFTATEPAIRLLTLTGTGGAGKTRLALHLAWQLATAFDQGVWWVELAQLTNPLFLPQALAKTLGIREQPEQPLLEQLQTALRGQSLLLVLDNCEHLITAVANLAATLLKSCPRLKILATSREPLGLTGETVWIVPPLSLPATATLPPAQLASYEAIQLFAARTAAVYPKFALTQENGAAIVYICQRLDGMPLAIELAVARLRVLTIPQLAARLEDRFQLLTGNNRDVLPRHQTLRAVVDWSYDLLNVTEKTVLQQLSVFAGSFSLAGATAVCAPTLPKPDALLDVLTHLVDKSLLVAEAESPEEMRYHMLETIRQYSQEKLDQAGMAHATQYRHLQWVCQLAEEAEPALLGAAQLLWLKRLDAEYDNINSALRWADQADGAAVEAGLRLGGALWRYWDRRGYLVEAQEMLEQLLARTEIKTAVPRAKALYSLGIVTHLQGKDVAATNLFMESLAMWQKLGANGALGAARAAHFIAFMALRRADYPTAHIWYEQCNGRYHQLQDAWGLSEAQSQMGTLALRQGNISQSRALQEEALTHKQHLGDMRGILFSVWALGNIARLQTNYPLARSYYAQAIQTAQHIEDKWSLPYCIEAFAYLAVAEQQPRRATLIFAAAESLRETTGAPLPPVWQADYAHALATLKDQLGAVAFAAIWQKGQTMELKSMITFALGTEG